MAITVPARASPVAKEMAERVASRITSGLRMIFRRRMGQPCGFSCATSFGPTVRARVSASACVRPLGPLRNPRRSSSPSFRAASSTAGETWMFLLFACFGISGSDGRTGGSAGFAVALSCPLATPALFASGVVILPAITVFEETLTMAQQVQLYFVFIPKKYLIDGITR